MQNKIPSLTPHEIHVLVNRGTDAPGAGPYTDKQSLGSYLCRSCGNALFRSDSKFLSSCGWPSFDNEISGAITRLRDPDGTRTEICCSRCNGHLGHVFSGENLTAKNLRHCVNSTSVDFVSSSDILEAKELILAGGCFWGLEHHMKQKKGVVFTQSGYTGGHLQNPLYNEICRGTTGHYEAVRILFDPEQTTDEEALKTFFEIHDPTQKNGQGNDIGSQYKSAIFYHDPGQKLIAEQLINLLKQKGYQVATELLEATTFWPAEKEHQDYLKNNPGGYCNHRYKPRFD